MVLLYPEHCKDEAAEKESKVGGRVDWWQKVELVHLHKHFDTCLICLKLTCSVKLFLSRCHLKLNLSSIGTETLKNLLRVRLALMKGRSVGEDESMAMLVYSSPSSSSILYLTLKSEIYKNKIVTTESINGLTFKEGCQKVLHVPIYPLSVRHEITTTYISVQSPWMTQKYQWSNICLTI